MQHVLLISAKYQVQIIIIIRVHVLLVLNTLDINKSTCTLGIEYTGLFQAYRLRVECLLLGIKPYDWLWASYIMSVTTV